MKLKLKIISIILAAVTLCSTLASCSELKDGNENDSQNTSDLSGENTDDKSSTDKSSTDKSGDNSNKETEKLPNNIWPNITTHTQ